MTETPVTAGIDIGGTNTAVGIVDPTGNILASVTLATARAGGAEEFVARIAQALNDECRLLPQASSLTGIGVASPAANMRNGTIHRPANLTWGTVHIVRMLKRHFDLPVAIVNDSNASALGEMHYGLAKKMKNFVVLTLGTGLGAGIVAQGELLQGESGLAGELGHVTFDPVGRECGCGRKGCAETYISATGLCRTAMELTVCRSNPSKLCGIPFDALTAKTVFELAVDGDQVAREAFAVTGGYLGRLFANVAAVFDPQAIIITGGLANAGELLVAPARKAFEAQALELHKGGVDILVSSLRNGQGAVLGASWLVREMTLHDVVR